MEYYRDIMYFFDPVINADGTRCGSVELLCSHLLAIPKMRKSSEAVPLETILIETILHRLLQAPVNKMQTALMFRVILEICQKSGAFAQTLALGVHCLFQMVPEMGMISLREFAQWFAMHLLNTKLSWPYWNAWIETCMDDKLDSSRTLFCKLVVDKMGRAVSHDVVTNAIPDTLHALLPKDALPDCSFQDDDIYKELFKELRNMIEVREEPELVMEWLESKNLEEGDMETDDIWRAPLLMQVILMIAGDVPSAFTNLVERYSEPLRTLSASDSGEIALVECIGASISHENGYLNKVFDTLLRRSIITATAAATWATSNSRLDSLATDVWTYKHLELISDRAIDIAKAAVSRRRDIDDDMVFDESTDTEPSSTFLIATKSSKVSEVSGDPIENTEAAVDDVAMDAGADDDDVKTEAINNATEAVISSLKASRVGISLLSII